MEKEFLYCGKDRPWNRRRGGSFQFRASALLLAIATNCCLLPMSSTAQPYALGGDPDHPTLNNGFHINEVDLSAGYADIKGPAGFLAGPQGQAFTGYSAWASASLGYSNINPNGSFVVIYTPSYTSVFRYSAHWFDQDLHLDWTRRLSTEWAFRFSGTARESTVEEFLFVPQGTVSSAGDYIYSPSLVNPTQALLFGTRVLSLNAGLGVTYSPSTRLHISLDARGDQIQSRPNPSEPAQYVIPRTRAEEGHLVVGYKASPKTEYGVEADYLQAQSVFGRYRTATAGLFAARRLGMRWSVNGSGFAAAISSVGQGSLPFTLSYGVSGNVRYQLRANSFSLSYRRSGGDSYGFGALSTTAYSALWSWRSRARTWSLQAVADRQQIEGGVVGGIDLWDGSLTVSRALSRRVALGVGASYLRETLPPGILAGETQAYIARLTLSWIPFLRDTPPLTIPVDQPIQDR